ncbi:MAG: hypothetical protein RIS73_1610 [Bacteroidota bacterium]|jgi:glucosylceramidase
MKKLLLFFTALQFIVLVTAQKKVNWISTTQTEQWKTNKDITTISSKDTADAELQLNKPLQQIDGFGTCFNELGWASLSMLKNEDREKILKELFTPDYGANFTICRMPVGANDFSNRWYSYNETPGDFEMKNFSIANDLQTLIPFIKGALKYNSAIKIWASPWSPPTWMKYNKHYASKPFPKGIIPQEIKDKWGIDFAGLDNGLQPEQEGFEGTNMFIQEEKYYKAYALYFEKFIKAYRAQRINISMVMPQNEFNSAQVFPSCTWTAKGLSTFISYLGPQMKAAGVNIFFGTMERANEKLVDTILTEIQSKNYIKGVGFQWAGKDAIAAINKKHPNLKLYQSEQECGNGKNDWAHCCHAWDLMKHYFNNGANGYMYWNTALKQGGISTWGWHQNSLVSVDTVNKTYHYNYEYYLMKHISHFVKPGAKRLDIAGNFDNILAFINKDKSIVVVAQNKEQSVKTIRIKIGTNTIEQELAADSFNTFILK